MWFWRLRCAKRTLSAAQKTLVHRTPLKTDLTESNAQWHGPAGYAACQRHVHRQEWCSLHLTALQYSSLQAAILLPDEVISTQLQNGNSVLSIL